MLSYNIEELKRIISPIARQHGVESVSLFGSYSNGTATAESDVDLKIEKGRCCSIETRDRIIIFFRMPVVCVLSKLESWFLSFLMMLNDRIQ